MYENSIKIQFDKGEAQLYVIRGSVLEKETDAIVNAANNTLLGGGFLDGAIHKAAGPKLRKECAGLNGCNTGDAKITRAYNIKTARYIIHTVGPIYKGTENDKKLLESCYKKSMDLAYKNKCRSISFPCISTGAYGYPLFEASKIAIRTVESWVEEHQNVEINVFFCCYKDMEYDIYKKLAIY